jgi:hypothetical protein
MLRTRHDVNVFGTEIYAGLRGMSNFAPLAAGRSYQKSTILFTAPMGLKLGLKHRRQGNRDQGLRASKKEKAVSTEIEQVEEILTFRPLTTPSGMSPTTPVTDFSSDWEMNSIRRPSKRKR